MFLSFICGMRRNNANKVEPFGHPLGTLHCCCIDSTSYNFFNAQNATFDFIIEFVHLLNYLFRSSQCCFIFLVRVLHRQVKCRLVNSRDVNAP